MYDYFTYQWQLPEVESRTQGSRPTPKKLKKSVAKFRLLRTDPIEAKYRNARGQGCRSLLSIEGNNLQFYPNFALSLTLGGINFDQWGWFFSGEQIKWRPKKDLYQKWNTFFPRIQVETCAQMHTRVKLFGRSRCRPYSNNWGGYSQNIWRIYPPIPPGFGTPAQGQGSRIQEQVFSKNKTKKSSSKIFSGDLQKSKKKVRANFPQGFCHFPTKFWPFKEYSAVLGQRHGNFRGLEASRPRPGTWPLRPKTMTSKWVLEVKDVLEDSISGNYIEPMLTPHHELAEEKSEQKR